MPSGSPRTRRPLVVASLMLATFMAAIEATIVATAMPRIVGELGGFAYYSWVFAAFLLAQTTTTVIYGKLADMFGRKPSLILGISLFLFGSLLCGFAWSMPSLILLPLAPRPRRRRHPADHLDRGRRPLQARGARQGAGADLERLGDLRGRGSACRRHHRRQPLLGLDLLDQHPDRLHRHCGLHPLPEGDGRAQERSIDYLGAALFSVAIVSLAHALDRDEGREPRRFSGLASSSS